MFRVFKWLNIIDIFCLMFDKCRVCLFKIIYVFKMCLCFFLSFRNFCSLVLLLVLFLFYFYYYYYLDGLKAHALFQLKLGPRSRPIQAHCEAHFVA